MREVFLGIALDLYMSLMDHFVCSDILQNVMLPYLEWKLPLDFVFQQDSDPKQLHGLLNSDSKKTTSKF